MQPNDERLRLAYGAALEARAGSDRSHPEPEALLAVAERSGSEAVRLEVLDHVMSCSTCRRELDLIRASAGAAGLPRQRTWFRSPSFAVMAIAAMLLIAAGVKVYLRPSADLETGPVLRGAPSVSTQPVRWTPAGATLAWRPNADAASYRLEVIDEAGIAVVDSTMRDTSFVLADSLARNRQGLSWTVTATLGDGSNVSSLPIRLVPPAR